MSTVMHVATRKGLFTLERTGREPAGWRIARVSFLADNCPIVMHDPRHDTLYAGLAHGHFGGKLHRSEDGGRTWAEIAVPTYPEPPAGSEEPVPAFGDRPVPWKLELLWSLAPGGAARPDRIWCGTIPGGLFVSDDRGDTWSLVRPLWDDPRRHEWFGGGYDFPGIHSILVDPRDADHVAVGVSCGGVWITADGGATWALGAEGMRAEYMPAERAGDPVVQDPHLLAACADEPDVVWTQHHNGIFRSADFGRTWRELSCDEPSAFGFAVAAHPHDPGTAWFVPAQADEQRVPVDGRVVVTRTRDAGESFEVLREGLPQSDAYDLTYRHALDVDETGECLAFGTTTGSLWTTDDGGDRWHGLSHHLPPVYAVRFAPS